MGQFYSPIHKRLRPALDTNAYSDGDQLGEAIEIANFFRSVNGHARIESIKIVDAQSRKAEIDIFFFNREPTVTSSDNDALNIGDTEVRDKYVGHVKVAASDYEDFSANAIATKSNLDMPVHAIQDQDDNPTGKSLWFILATRSAVTYAASDLEILIDGQRI